MNDTTARERVAAPALALSGVRKRYGSVDALAGLDMHVGDGEIYGFLGRNGAGKSTALRIIMGVTHADSGSLSLFGRPIRGTDPVPRRQIGYVAQEQNFYGWMTPRRLGRFVGGFYPNWSDAEYRDWLERLDLPTERRVDGFSGGMTAKLALALALAARPRLLLLDEPTAGMDAVARQEFLAIVRQASAEHGRTTVFSSHLIDEVELAADRVGIVDEGVMRFEGTLETLRQSVQRLVSNGETETRPDLGDGIVLRERDVGGQREIFVQDAPLVTEPPPGWRTETPSLEAIFVAMVGRAPA